MYTHTYKHTKHVCTHTHAHTHTHTHTHAPANTFMQTHRPIHRQTPNVRLARQKAVCQKEHLMCFAQGHVTIIFILPGGVQLILFLS